MEDKNKKSDFITKIRLENKAKDELIVDCHAHYGLHNTIYAPYWSEKEFINYIDTIGIDYICISHLLSLGPDFRSGNDEVARLMKRYPDRIIGQAVMNLNYVSGIKFEMERCLIVLDRLYF